MKEAIRECLNTGECELAQCKLNEYKKIHPADTDIVVFETEIALQLGNLNKAEEWAKKGIALLPTSADMHYNLACVFELQKNYYDCIREYMISGQILELCGETEKKEELLVSEKLDYIISEWEQSLTTSLDMEKLKKANAEMKKLDLLSRNVFGFRDTIFRCDDESIGHYYYENEDEHRYIGKYFDQYSSELRKEGLSLIETKGEFLKVHEGTCIQYKENSNCLLPIATECDDTILKFKQGENELVINQRYREHFQYYCLDEPTEIISEKKCYFGEPVLLRQNEKNKKLVLNLFVDGLAQDVICRDDLKKIMPNTYAFFKKGTICENAYCSAEWTYPSIANFITSTNTVEHKLFHNIIDTAIRKDVKTLAEYFQDAGYYTAMFNGDWRITPQYGHARGYQRYVYQNGNAGFKIGSMIHETIGHIETFKDTNQFVWMSVGELHDIADGFYLPTQVMRNLEPKYQQMEDVGNTSVKQGNSLQKKNAFIRQATYVDFWLGFLYNYIEKNYDDNDIIISLFADHGQGYLIPEDGHFLAKERCNIAFMFRGSNVEAKHTDELMSSSDYLPIMCKLAGISLNNSQIDGILPVCFGGEKERAFAYTESLHPKDPYYATIFSNDAIVYFQSDGACTNEGKFLLGDYKLQMTDYDGNVINNTELLKFYEGIILKHIEKILIYN